MALKERKVIDKIEILRDGAIQVREATEIYDTLVDTSEGASDIKSQSYHRKVIAKSDAIPADVQAFIDNVRV